MAIPPQVKIYWVDVNLKKTVTTHSLIPGATNAQVLAFVGAMSAASNAGVRYYEIFHPLAVTPTIGGAGPYQSTIDKAKMSYLGASGQQLRIGIPAPLATDFLTSNKLTVDVLNANVIAFNTAASAHLVDASGTAIAQFESGIRTRGKGKRLSR